MESKRTRAIQKFQNWDSDMTCPICHSPLAWTDNQVRCSNNHSFDLAKQGYINLAPNHQEAHYNKDLFESRYRIMAEALLYDGIYDQMLDLLIAQGIELTNARPPRIIDLGTGEGTHLHHFVDTWGKRTGAVEAEAVNALGLDLAKDGILVAAKHYTNALWMVADLSQLPFKEASIDGALTILSPSNYPELQRVMKDNAWFIKVIPGPHYLRELREIVIADEADRLQDPTPSTEKFKAAFRNVGSAHFERRVPLNSAQMSDLIKMTPLMWHADEDQIAAASALDHITVDLILLFGQK
ncbi:guanine methyltransferase [Aerococcus agrisoli]|uniref:Guanine methyltransferase n=2 Tax=Aerococcus agrisoli TaxID=2487350 RepID=A0A3N4GNB4_9LACT|nr:guanine methyltransferase [Aerococcus agrisoli]